MSTDNIPSSSSSSLSSSSDSSLSDDDEQTSSSASSSGDNDFDQIKETFDSIDEMVLTGDDDLEDFDESIPQHVGIEEVQTTPVNANEPSNRDHRLPSRTNNCAPSQSSQLLYHGIFTSFQLLGET